MSKDKSEKQNDELSTETPTMSLAEKAKLYTDHETEQDYQLDSPFSEPIFRLSLLQTNSEEVMNMETGETELRPGWYGSQDDSFLNPLRETLTGEILFFTLIQNRYDGEYVKGQIPVCKASDGQTGIGDPGGICRICPYYRNGQPDSCKGGIQLILNLHLDAIEEQDYGFNRYPVVVRFASKGINPLQRFWRTVKRELKKPLARVTVEISSEKIEDQKGRKFYVPALTPVDILDNDQWPLVREDKAKLMQTMVPEISKLTWELDDVDTMNAIPDITGGNDYIRGDDTTFPYGDNAPLS